jgi:hypothetical protein
MKATVLTVAGVLAIGVVAVWVCGCEPTKNEATPVVSTIPHDAVPVKDYRSVSAETFQLDGGPSSSPTELRPVASMTASATAPVATTPVIAPPPPAKVKGKGKGKGAGAGATPTPF